MLDDHLTECTRLSSIKERAVADSGICEVTAPSPRVWLIPPHI
jgi:hypothetical protein